MFLMARAPLAVLLAPVIVKLPEPAPAKKFRGFVEAVGSDLLEEVLARLQPIFEGGSLG